MPKDIMSLYKELYTKFSSQYGPDTCIFLMVGKFYELYALYKEDLTPVALSVKKASELMNIALKEFPVEGGFTKLWSGIPEQSLHKFAMQLTREGWTVVVVDQVKNASDLVIDRIPTRILSPGTHVEAAGPERLSVAGLWIELSGNTAASVLDLMTGETVSFCSTRPDEILHMMQVYGVKEVVIASEESTADESSYRSMYGFGSHVSLRVLPANTFQLLTSSAFRREEFFRKMFKIRSVLPVRSTLHLEGEHPSLELSVVVLLRFVEDHFPHQAERLTVHKVYTPAQHMRLSNNILEQLNILTQTKQKSVLSLLERTHSALGKRMLRERILRPVTDPTVLESRWTHVEFLQHLSKADKMKLERYIKGLYDIPRLHYKLSEGKLEASDVQQLFWSYQAASLLANALRATPLAQPESLRETFQAYREHFTKLLDEAKANQRVQGEYVGFLTPMSGPRCYTQEQTIAALQQGWTQRWTTFCSTATNLSPDTFHMESKGDDEWMWEGPRGAAKAIRAVIDSKVFTGRGASTTASLTNLEIHAKSNGPITLTSTEWTTFCDSLRTNVRLLNAALREEVRLVCDDLWEQVKIFQDDWIEWLGSVDCSLALATVAEEYGWCKPKLGEGLEAIGLRHPLLETAATRAAYVKHDVCLGSDGSQPKGWLIYGVNASGKSSLMKAVGIAVILAQAGSFVPATSFSLRPYDAAFSRIWNHDNVWAGLSSFAVEVSELRGILQCATKHSLVLGDEVCSGTESSSATALVAAVLEHLDSLGAHFIFATHLHDVLKVPGFLPRPSLAVYHLRVDRTPEGKLIYDRRLQPGPGSTAYGLEVAKAMGLPLTLMDRAHEIRRALGGMAAAEEAPTSSWNAQIQRQACEMCGHAIIRNLEVHHLTPRAEGGSNVLRNLAVLCETCHDKHHAGELEVGELQMTSDGLERSTVVSETTITKAKKKQELKWSEDEIKVIQVSLTKHKGRPMTRIVADLEEQGIHMTTAQLKKFTCN